MSEINVCNEINFKSSDENNVKRVKETKTYEVGSRIKCYKKSSWYFRENWVITEIKDNKITIKQLSLELETRTYTMPYFKTLIKKGKVEIMGKIGSLMEITNEQKEEIRKLKIFNMSIFGTLQEIAFLGAERCDWRLLCHPKFVSNEQFEGLMCVLNF